MEAHATIVLGNVYASQAMWGKIVTNVSVIFLWIYLLKKKNCTYFELKMHILKQNVKILQLCVKMVAVIKDDA